MDCYPLRFHRQPLRVLRNSMKNYDHHRSGAGKSRHHPKWRRFFGDTSRRWRMFRLSNQAIAIHRHTTRRGDAVGDNLLRPHLFGITGGRSNGLGQRSFQAILSLHTTYGSIFLWVWQQLHTIGDNMEKWKELSAGKKRFWVAVGIIVIVAVVGWVTGWWSSPPPVV